MFFFFVADVVVVLVYFYRDLFYNLHEFELNIT